MANVVYNEGKRLLILSGWGALTLGVMLVKPTYVANPDHAALDDGSANDPASHEIVAGGYARQALSGIVVGKDNAADFGYLDADDVPFGSLATGDTVSGIVVFINTGGVDTARVPLMFFDIPDTPTNGSAMTVQWAAVAAGALLKAA